MPEECRSDAVRLASEPALDRRLSDPAEGVTDIGRDAVREHGAPGELGQGHAHGEENTHGDDRKRDEPGNADDEIEGEASRLPPTNERDGRAAEGGLGKKYGHEARHAISSHGECSSPKSITTKSLLSSTFAHKVMFGAFMAPPRGMPHHTAESTR